MNSSLPGRSRQAVRAMLLTEDGRVLMLRLKNSRGVFWIAPGGGINAGETDHEALHRELYEETGLVKPDIGPLIWTRQTTYILDEHTPNAVEIFQSERFFVVPVTRFAAHAENMPQETERDWFEDFAWLNVDDIESSAERILPTQLGRYLRLLIGEGIPSEPIDVGH